MSPTWIDRNHSGADWHVFTYNCHLIYKCTQIGNMLQSVWVSLLRWALCNRGFNSNGCIVIIFLYKKARLLSGGHCAVKAALWSSYITRCGGISVSDLRGYNHTPNVSGLYVLLCVIFISLTQLIIILSQTSKRQLDPIQLWTSFGQFSLVWLERKKHMLNIF